MKLGVSAAALETGLAGRLAWITGLRLLFLTLLLVAIAFFYLKGGLAEYPLSSRIVFMTIAAGFAQAALYAAALRAGKRLETLAYVEIVVDQLTWTAIVYVSGGATSGATSFYALTCLVGAILVGIRGAFAAAASGIAVYAMLCGSFWLRWVQPPHDQAAASYAVDSAELVYPLLVNSLGIIVVSLLAGYLAERLRLAGGALEAATQRALEAERLATLGRVAAGLAHEIRNPLGSIRGSIEMLRESSALDDEDRRLCDIIHREAARLNNLVGDMVDLSKPRVPRAEAVDVARLAREVVALASNAERGADVAVVYDGPDAPTTARCDAAQMRQVLWNLVRNAIQASPAGAQVTVRVAREGRDVVLSVDDDGPGVPGEDVSRIFDSFYTTRSHGAGIGLAVVKRIIDDHAAMGARISVRSPPKGGASFRIVLNRDVAGLQSSPTPPVAFPKEPASS
jgi:two-component system, NtrC family, sensor histidine kinase HydH